MLRYLAICFCSFCLLFSAGCRKSNDIRTLSKHEVYFFYQTACSHCHMAAKYIKDKHPWLKVKALDVSMPGNMRLLQEAAKTYKIGDAIGTPLICFGENFIMGWGSDEERKFDEFSVRYE